MRTRIDRKDFKVLKKIFDCRCKKIIGKDFFFVPLMFPTIVFDKEKFTVQLPFLMDTDE